MCGCLISETLNLEEALAQFSKAGHFNIYPNSPELMDFSHPVDNYRRMILPFTQLKDFYLCSISWRIGQQSTGTFPLRIGSGFSLVDHPFPPEKPK